MDLSLIESGQILVDEVLAISNETINSYLVVTNDEQNLYKIWRGKIGIE